jgi:hypothetical protein
MFQGFLRDIEPAFLETSPKAAHWPPPDVQADDIVSASSRNIVLKL